MTSVSVLRIEGAPIRSERGEPVDGLLLLAEKPAATATLADPLGRADEPEAPERLPQ